jgi:hypothetical protein
MITQDLRKEFKHLYSASAKKVDIVHVPRLQFAMISGEIEPGNGPGTSPSFQQATEALYGISYTLKFMSKLRKENPIDYPVMALEGLWWVEGTEFIITQPGGWRYILMILQPDHITPDYFQEGLQQLTKKRGNIPAISKLTLDSFEEGPCIQILHIGPYSTEMETVARMDDFAKSNGFALHGKHHEIYLGDPRKAQPEKLRTILRHPIMPDTATSG